MMIFAFKVALATVCLSSCALPSDHSNAPRCRKQVAQSISSLYPDTVALNRALDVVCTGIQDPYPTAVP